MAPESKNEVKIFKSRVLLELHGQRFDHVAASLFPDFSRARLQKWIRDGHLTVDGRVTKPSHKMAGGETLRLEAEAEHDGTVVAQDLPLELVYADDQLLVINKPAGLVVHPAAGHPDGTLQNALLFYDGTLAGVPRGGIVHRLDKDTSGIMVVARSLKAHASLVSQLQDRSMSRVYETVVHGQAKRRGCVEAEIGRHPRDRKRMAVVAGGKPAVSHYRRLARHAHFTHLEVSLESGRTHQIRVHMQHIGLPLVGDPTYGRKTGNLPGLDAELLQCISAFPRQALHARTLRLVHPDTGELMEFNAPLPDDLAVLLDSLKNLDAT